MALDRRFDAVIIGGGPAGSAVARLLASWGHDALLLTKPQQRDRSLGESLPPSCRKLLDEIGVLRRPAVRNHRIELEEQLDKDGIHSPLRFLRDVDVVQLVAIAAEHDQVPDLFEAYNRLGRPATLPDFLGVLSALVAKGLLYDRQHGSA